MWYVIAFLLGLLSTGASAKKKVVVCTCSVENKGDDPECKKCFPDCKGWVKHPGEDEGRATVPPQDPTSAAVGVDLSHKTNPRQK